MKAVALAQVISQLNHTVSRTLTFFALLLGVSAATGCGGVRGYYSTYVPEFHPTANTHVVLGTIDDHTPSESREKIPPDFKPAAELGQHLEANLKSAGIKGEAGGGDFVVLIPTIVDYQPGSAFIRWAAPGEIGATVLLVRCKLEQGGKEVGTINVRRTVEFGGAYSIGQWKLVFQAVASDIVDELKTKIRSGT